MRCCCPPVRVLLLLACTGLTAGCEPAAPQTVRVQTTGPTEPAWEAQIERVRSGQTSEIRFASRPVSPTQWRMLRQQCELLEVLEADVSRLRAGDWDVLEDLPGLRRLKLTGPVDDEALRRIRSAGELTILNLPDGRFTDAGLGQLDSLQKLELLRIGSPRLTDAGLAVLPRLKALRFLHLINVPVTDAGLRHLQTMSHLESFYLDGGRCTDEGLYALLKALPKLHFHRDQLHLPDDPQAHPHAGAADSQ